MGHDRRRTFVDEHRPGRVVAVAGSRGRRMIDLRGYLYPLDRPSGSSANPDEHRGPVTDTRVASGVRGRGRRAKVQWPRLPDEQDRGADAVIVRARLGSYQRALTSARKTLRKAHPASVFHPVGTSLFITNDDGGAGTGSSARQGGDL